MYSCLSLCVLAVQVLKPQLYTHLTFLLDPKLLAPIIQAREEEDVCTDFICLTMLPPDWKDRLSLVPPERP
jgi:hypothetical protein